MEDAESRREEDHVQSDERVHTVDELPTHRRDQGLGFGEQNLSEYEQRLEGSSIENKASGRTCPCVWRTESLFLTYTCCLDRHRKPSFCGSGRAKVTSELVRP